jgi:hypothetical protein
VVIGAYRDSKLCTPAGGIAVKANDAERITIRFISGNKGDRPGIIYCGQFAHEWRGDFLNRLEKAQPTVLNAHMR